MLGGRPPPSLDRLRAGLPRKPRGSRSGIFKSSDPERRARAIVEATTHADDPERVAAASMGLGEPMRGDDIADLAAQGELLQHRGS